jgi:hypothetical protein
MHVGQSYGVLGQCRQLAACHHRFDQAQGAVVRDFRRDIKRGDVKTIIRDLADETLVVMAVGGNAHRGLPNKN